ncbi:MAG TPA: hypothetical protein VGQ39_02435 [Pyrinomonadaceae bacterium]|jgi:hypothetical protein|nr:hypothetical protein [Pyrinomonadaceae bacterium]
MRILTYKRTHVGDPDKKGRFGIYDCMRSVRSYEYDAVIGVRGVGREPKSFGIDNRINWVGMNPLKYQSRKFAGVEVTFQHFLLLDDQGPLLKELAPLLAERMYVLGARILLSGYSVDEQAEAERIINWSRRQSPPLFKSTNRSGGPKGCKNRCKLC